MIIIYLVATTQSLFSLFSGSLITWVWSSFAAGVIGTIIAAITDAWPKRKVGISDLKAAQLFLDLREPLSLIPEKVDKETIQGKFDQTIVFRVNQLMAREHSLSSNRTRYAFVAQITKHLSFAVLGILLIVASLQNIEVWLRILLLLIGAIIVFVASAPAWKWLYSALKVIRLGEFRQNKAKMLGTLFSRSVLTKIRSSFVKLSDTENYTAKIKELVKDSDLIEKPKEEAQFIEEKPLA